MFSIVLMKLPCCLNTYVILYVCMYVCINMEKHMTVRDVLHIISLKEQLVR